jgi:hypothetical protein
VRCIIGSSQGDEVNVRIRGKIGRGLVGLTVLGTVAGSTAIIASPAHAVSQTAAVALSDASINSSLAALAKAFAAAMTDQTFRRTIHTSVGEKFDGDTEVLWKTLSTKSGIQTTLARTTAQATGITSRSAQSSIQTLAAGIPRFQVAVPANYGTWNPSTYAPLVAYNLEGVDDTTLKTITAYDATGKVYQLDAQVSPKQPVIVLGVNERTDDTGALLRTQVSTSGKTTAGVQAAAAAETYRAHVEQAVILNDQEPWASGDAEIYLAARSRGCDKVTYKDDYESLNNDGDVWNGHAYLGSTTCDVVFKWMERDGSELDITLSFNNWSMGIKANNGDDLVGEIQLPHAWFEGVSNKRTNMNNIQFVTE